jgi:twitching motility protein PilT
MQPLDESREIDRFLRQMVELHGSDLHMKSGSTPKVRINGQITDLSREVLSPQGIDNILKDVMSDREQQILYQQCEVDFIYQVRNLGRFRINVYQQMHGLSISIRYIQIVVPSFEELNLPPALYELLSMQRGLILITGATGSGKSTTLAAIVETLNRTTALNIVTVEDPIEFMYREKKSTIQQREIGRDTLSWKDALHSIARQDPDVIVLGEIRDWETMSVVLTAANSGHLVLAIMNTMDAAQTINRILAISPHEMIHEVRHLLATTLVGIVSQRLLLRANGQGRVPAVEVLAATETIRKLIINPDDSLNLRRAMMESQGQNGMQTFDQSLMQLYRAGLIRLEDALKYATSQTEFRVRMRGLDGQPGTGWNALDRNLEENSRSAANPQ